MGKFPVLRVLADTVERGDLLRRVFAEDATAAVHWSVRDHVVLEARHQVVALG